MDMAFVSNSCVVQRQHRFIIFRENLIVDTNRQLLVNSMAISVIEQDSGETSRQKP